MSMAECAARLCVYIRASNLQNLIHKKCRYKSFHNDIKYYMMLNTIFSAFRTGSHRIPSPIMTWLYFLEMNPVTCVES